MTIDRNERAKIAVIIRKDGNLTLATKAVATTLLLCFMNKVSRAFPSISTISRESGVSIASVNRAIPILVKYGYIQKFQRRVRQATYVSASNRYIPTMLSNLYLWCFRLNISSTQKTMVESKKDSERPSSSLQVGMESSLQAALARFGNAIADKYGLPAAAT